MFRYPTLPRPHLIGRFSCWIPWNELLNVYSGDDDYKNVSSRTLLHMVQIVIPIQWISIGARHQSSMGGTAIGMGSSPMRDGLLSEG